MAWHGMACPQVIGIDVDDPLAKDLNDIADVEKLLPGYVSGIREWFRWYKTPDDKPLNAFGFGEKALGKVRTSTFNDEPIPPRRVFAISGRHRGINRANIYTLVSPPIFFFFFSNVSVHFWRRSREMTFVFFSLFFCAGRMRR